MNIKSWFIDRWKNYLYEERRMNYIYNEYEERRMNYIYNEYELR